MSAAAASSKLPEPAPITGSAIDENPSCRAMRTALQTERRIEPSEAIHSMLMPATWMIALLGSRPAEVSLASPSGSAR